MRQFLAVFFRAGFVLLILMSPLAAETQTPYEAAKARAYVRIMEARADGLSIVHTATEIYPEGDKLCVTDFTLVSVQPPAVRVSDRECFQVMGASGIRKNGLQRERLAAVRQYVLSYPDCGTWPELVSDVLNRPDIFPELQHLVVYDALVRGYVLRIVVGHKVMFYDPMTKGLKQC